MSAEVVALRPDSGPPVADCPVVPLGMRGGVFYFASPSGQFRAFEEAKLSKLGITGLFESEIDWLWDRWPRTNKEGEVTSWSPAAAAEYLIGACSRKGLFDPDTMVRGPGVWACSDPGEGSAAAAALIVHAGDWLLLPTSATHYKRERAGQDIQGLFYAAAPAEQLPDVRSPATQEDAQALRQHLSRWNWRDPSSSPVLWLGWTAAACVGGALRWRPHLQVAGDMGTGKTELEHLMAGLFGTAVARVSDPSAAGVRGMLNNAARPLLVDEVEPGSRRAEQVYELARLASSDGQGDIVRSDSSHQTRRWKVRASFYMTSILHPRPMPQDRSRITFLDLEPLRPDADVDAIIAGRRRFAAMGARLRGRMILGWPRLQENLLVFASVLSSNAHTRRQADQLGTLLAAAATFLWDDPVEGSAASDLVDELGLARPEDAEHDHDEWLNHLLSSPVEAGREGVRDTIGELIWQAMDSTDAGYTARDRLRRLGIGVEPGDVGDRWCELLIANQHQGLARVFEGTRWARGVWSQAARRLPEARCFEKLRSFAGAKQRSTALPRMLFEDLRPAKRESADKRPEPPPPDGGDAPL